MRNGQGRAANAEQRAQLAAHLIGQLHQAAAPSRPAARVGSPVPAAAVARERFILFAPPLVSAILDGRKTVTRRLVTPPGQPAGPCPFGAVGDTLWVREKWGYRDEFFDRRARGAGPFVYAADGPPPGARFPAWRPSLHMPRSACRLVLTITHTRAERLTQIRPEDAAAEGCPPAHRQDPIGWFHQLWDQLNVERGNGWATDPWVWVISFVFRTR